MSNVARFPSFNSDSYTDEELRLLACQAYCDAAGGNHLTRIARRVGKPIEVIRQWHSEDAWILKRAQARKQKDETKLAELTAMLEKAGVKDSKTDALETLKLLQDAKAIAQRHVKALLNREHISGHVDHPDNARFLRQVLTCLEQIDKLGAGAYARL